MAGLWPSVCAITPPAKLNGPLINFFLKKVQRSCDVGFCACANNEKANKHQAGTQMLRGRTQPPPILQRPTAVGNSGEYRLIISIKQPDGGIRSRLPGLEAPPGLEHPWLGEFKMEI